MVLAAFKKDCLDRNIDWVREEGQRFATDLFLRHRLSVCYPPRRSVLKNFLKLYIAAIEQELAVRSTSEEATNAPGEEASEDQDPIYVELLTAHIDMFIMADTDEPSMCFKTFCNLYTPQRDKKGAAEGDHRFLTSPSFFHIGDETSCGSTVSSRLGAAVCDPYGGWTWNVLQVSSDTFKNVGLSLWPAAFALVQLLSQEFSGESKIIPSIAAASSPSLRIVELGAGVGLTPCVLATHPGYKAKVKRFCATDYQVELIENMRKNLWLNHLVECESGLLETQTLTHQQRLEVREMNKSGESARHQPCGDASESPPLRGLDVAEEDLNNILRYRVQVDRDGSPMVTNRLQLLDWNELERCESFFSSHGCDLMLAADCVYDVSVIDALVSVINAGLEATSVEDALAAELQRRKGDSGIPRATQPRTAVVVQTHRQAATMKKFFDALSAHNLCVVTYRLLQLPLPEAKSALSSGAIPLGNWAFSSAESQIVPQDRVCVLQPDRVCEDGQLESMTQGGEEDTEAMRDGFIGPYYVSMVGLIGVHVISKKT